MINCEYCSYYEKKGGGRSAAISGSTGAAESASAGALCVFTDTLILAGAEKSDMDYLCKNVSYGEYEERVKVRGSGAVFKLDDWRFAYKSKHPVFERKRSICAV